MPKLVASIEARMGSSRLPGKMLKDVAGQPALTRLIRRLKHCRKLDAIVLATTSAPADEVLVDCARAENILYYRGSEEDVLARVVEAQQFAESDIVVEINGDCILLDPQIVDMGISSFLENDCDVVSNCRKPGYPMGMGVQVFGLDILKEVEREIDDLPVREHVSLYFYEHPERYKIIHLMPPARWSGPDYRFQLDYSEDLQFINEIYRALEPAYGEVFGLEEIMNLLRDNPKMLEINSHCKEKAAR